MDESGNEDLPNLEIEGHFSNEHFVVTKVDVDAEIAKNLKRKELKKKISEEKLHFEEEAIASPKFIHLPESKIQSFPPSRQFFHPENSLKSFNWESLSVRKLTPSNYKNCSSENADEFFFWVESKIKISNNDIREQFFKYLWLLMSCHPDPFVIQKCRDVLIEYNTSWKLLYEEVILIFFNWGASCGDFASELDLHCINASLHSSPLISAANVENALHVLSSQLLIHDLDGNDTCSKSVFILLTLLTLDENLYSCLSEVSACLEQLAQYAKLKNTQWVEEYCQTLLQIETHHARIAFLIECVVPDCMRWCLCLVHCQRVFSLQTTFQANPQPLLLTTILSNNFDIFINLESWELYSLISIVDAGISQVISYKTDNAVKRGFLDWLNEYMERKIERRTPDIDIDGTLIIQLVSRLQAEWESTWLQEPSVPTAPEIEADDAKIIN